MTYETREHPPGSLAGMGSTRTELVWSEGAGDVAGRHKLIDRVMGTPDLRKILAARRRCILAGDIGHEVVASLVSTHFDARVRERLARHVRKTHNLGQDITGAICVTYKVQPRRRTGKARSDKALALLNKKTRWWTLAPKLNRLAWWVGPTLEVCVPNEGLRGFRRALVTPDVSDVDLVDGRYGTEVGRAAWKTIRRGRPAVLVVDEETFRWHAQDDKRGEIETIAHGVKNEFGEPMFPGTPWRYDEPEDEFDWWQRDMHCRAVDATIEIGSIATMLSWVRKVQNRKTFFAAGRLQGLDGKAKFDPERAILWDVSQMGEVLPTFQIHDMDQPPDSFQRHIEIIAGPVIESYGIYSSSVASDYTSIAPSVAQVEIGQERLAQIRDEQIPFAIESEVRSAMVATQIAKLTEWPEAGNLPSPEDIADKLVVEFPPLSRMEDPTKRKQIVEFNVGRGYSTDALEFQRMNPHLTIEEAKKQLHAYILEQTETNQLKASGRQELAAEIKTDNQVTGEMGGRPPSPVTEDPQHADRNGDASPGGDGAAEQ